MQEDSSVLNGAATRINVKIAYGIHVIVSYVEFMS